VNKELYKSFLSDLDLFHWVEVITNENIYYTQICPYPNISKTTIVESVIKKPCNFDIEAGKCIIKKLQSSITAKVIDISLSFSQELNHLEVFGDNFEELSNSLKQMVIKL
jgi:hypothetical protein